MSCTATIAPVSGDTLAETVCTARLSPLRPGLVKILHLRQNGYGSMPCTFGFADSITKYSSGACAPLPWPRPKWPAGSRSGSPVNT